MRRRFLIWCAFVFLASAAILGVLYTRVIPGLSSARTEPPAAETIIATSLLHQSVPLEAKMSVNPAPDPSDAVAGKDLYRQKCETCHGYDGSGRTPIGANEFPRVPTLRSDAIAATSDGELFYHIRNGIRNTGMPAWDLPDRQIWQLVSFIRRLPEVAMMAPEAATAVFRLPHPRRCRRTTGITSGRPPARDVMKRSMRAGARPAWPTSCATPANIPTPSFQTFQSPIRS
jgi:mono/diheme cytochrome c family protein